MGKVTKRPARALLLPLSAERWERHVRLPGVLAADGTLRAFSGERWPKVAGDVVVDVVIPVPALVDEIERRTLLQEREVDMLPCGAEARFRVSGKGVPGALRGALLDGLTAYPEPGPMVSVTLTEPLKLKLQPGRHAKLSAVQCVVTSTKQQAFSLNEAYRLLSQSFEPHRRSFGGSVFLRGYYCDEGQWIQLDALRRWLEAGQPNPVLP